MVKSQAAARAEEAQIARDNLAKQRREKNKLKAVAALNSGYVSSTLGITERGCFFFQYEKLSVG